MSEYEKVIVEAEKDNIVTVEEARNVVAAHRDLVRRSNNALDDWLRFHGHYKQEKRIAINVSGTKRRNVVWLVIVSLALMICIISILS